MRHWLFGFIAAFALLAANNMVMAHAKLVTSVPSDGSHVAAGLSQISLTFSQSMRLTVVKIKEVQAKTEIAPTQDLPAGFVKTATVEIPPLKAGSYRVVWAAVATDGHIMTGTVAFIVDGAAETVSEQP